MNAHVTAAVVEYLLQRDAEHGHWRAVSRRPPSEVSPFTTTYLALRGLSKFGTSDQQKRIKARIVAFQGRSEAFEPSIDRLHAFCVQRAGPRLRFAPARNEAGSFEDLEVRRDGRLRERELIHHLRDRCLALGEKSEDAATGRVGERGE